MTLLKLFLLPVFLHVLLVTIVGVATVRARIRTVLAGETKLRDIALGSNAWPVRVRQLGNNFDNQFDVPMMWYACTGLIIATGFIDPASVVLSWLFFATRIAHSWVHTGSNNVPLRMRVFLAGYAILMVLWAWFAWRLLAAG